MLGYCLDWTTIQVCTSLLSYWFLENQPDLLILFSLSRWGRNHPFIFHRFFRNMGIERATPGTFRTCGCWIFQMTYPICIRVLYKHRPLGTYWTTVACAYRKLSGEKDWESVTVRFPRNLVISHRYAVRFLCETNRYGGDEIIRTQTNLPLLPRLCWIRFWRRVQSAFRSSHRDACYSTT